MHIKSVKSNNKTMQQTVIQRLIYIEEEREEKYMFLEEEAQKMKTEHIRQTERVEPITAYLRQNESARQSSTRA